MIDYVINSVFNSITYIIPVGNQRDCWLVDCGDVEKVIDKGWNIKGVLLTHSHSDHIYGLNILMEFFPDALVYTNEAGALGLRNPMWNLSKYQDDVENFVFSKPENIRVIVSEGRVSSDLNQVEVLFTPGHEPSCLTYKLDDMLFTGDAYIPGVKTVTIFPRSNKILAEESLIRLQELEKKYGYTVCAGHPSNFI